MKKFIAHLHEVKPAFICEPAGSPKKTRKEFPIEHRAGPKATPKQLERLKALAGKEFKSIKMFYALMNGGLFYVHGNDAGIYIPSIKHLPGLNKSMREWIFDESTAPEFQKKGFAFGEIVGSGNYFIAYKGRIHYADHDGGGNKAISGDIGKFFEKIAKNPAKFLMDCGCYTRYSDGKTAIQWIPEKYKRG